MNAHTHAHTQALLPPNMTLSNIIVIQQDTEVLMHSSIMLSILSLQPTNVCANHSTTNH